MTHWLKGRSTPVRVLAHLTFMILVFALSTGMGVAAVVGTGTLTPRNDGVGLLEGEEPPTADEQDVGRAQQKDGAAERGEAAAAQSVDASRARDPVLVGAGDIASCPTQGDNAYPDGTAAQFRDCYLRYDFEQGILTESSSNRQYVVDTTAGGTTGHPHHGYLGGAGGGAVGLVSDPARGSVAKFPEPCSPTATTGCPKAMIKTDPAQSDDLNPRSAPFAFGAVLLMEPSHLTGGSNVVQKGLYDDPGGQWKLQVDSPLGSPGRPSCSVRGSIDEEPAEPVSVKASGVDVADGGWHRVVCRRTEKDRLAIIVDGVWQDSKPVPPGLDIGNGAPVSVGAKHLNSDDNDQFHGALSRVFFRLD